MSDRVIDARDLVREYRVGAKAVRALAGVSLQVSRGEFVALIGTSGSGKSTLLSVLGCLDRPDRGEYFLEGRPVHALSNDALAKVRNERIGFVFQSFNLLDRQTAEENVALPLRYAGVPRAERLRRAVEMLGQVGLADRVGHRPDELSGGQRQRVAIARALIADPDLILADEPTGNLDSKSGEEILDLFRGLHAQGRTLVMVTHDEHIAAVAQRRVRLEDGLVVSDERLGGEE
ncbi:MAG: ABC transporter ATP-binding protein [Alphaproteobacteria bacterium]|nr:ABC transporter ATP-binding protein [Alphaproteobacteria bacterium]MCB9792878.1 ABC transporter ATP-binding protein [Alphaproteobacteria bacterium]